MCLNPVQGKVRVQEVLRVEMTLIIASERLKKWWQVTLVEHWFTEKYEVRKELFTQITKRMVVARKALYIPG